MIAAVAKSNFTSAVAPRWGLVALAILFFGTLFYVRLHSFHKSIEIYAMEEVDAGEELEGGTRNTEKTAAFLLMALVSIWCILTPSGGKYEIRWLLMLLLATHLAMCVASISWSANPPMSMRRVAMLLVCALAAMGLGRQLNFRELLIFMVGLASCYSVVGVVAEVLLGTFRPWASDYRFAGTVHPNEQGMLCGATMAGAVMLAMEFPRYRLVLWGLACTALCGLLLSKSRTAMACSACSLGLSCVLLLPVRYWPHLFTAGGFSLASLIAVISAMPAQYLGDFREMALMGRSEGAANLTGRLPVWEGLLPHLKSHIWTGFGYRSFWDKARVEEFRDYTGGWQVPDSHNSYLEMLLNVGVIGAAPFLLAMLIAFFLLCVRGMKKKDSAAAFFAGITLTLFIAGFTEATLFNNTMFNCLMVTCAVSRLALHRNADEAVSVDSPNPSSFPLLGNSTPSLVT